MTCFYLCSTIKYFWNWGSVPPLIYSSVCTHLILWFLGNTKNVCGMRLICVFRLCLRMLHGAILYCVQLGNGSCYCSMSCFSDQNKNLSSSFCLHFNHLLHGCFLRRCNKIKCCSYEEVTVRCFVCPTGGAVDQLFLLGVTIRLEWTQIK